MLGTSRTNPMRKPEDWQKLLSNIEKAGLDAIVAIGGDDTLSVAAKLHEEGVKVVGIPKTMDNDVAETDYCIGFDTAVTTVADALDRLHTTADAHHRAMIVEVMGRDAGWVAVVGGLAGGADFILIPEVPCSIDTVCEHVKHRWAQGKLFSIIVVSEGAHIPEVQDRELGERDAFGHVRLDRRGIGETVAKEIERRTSFESRAVVLGHLQRGGAPTTFDRVLATRFGVAAVRLLHEGKYGYMVALQGNKIVPVELSRIANHTRTVDLELYQMAQVFY
jgi:6-phosphofructokinase 1